MKPDIAVDLSDEDREKLSNILEKLMGKYSRMSDTPYFNGVVDGLNHAHKLINGEVDDYLSDIDPGNDDETRD